MMGLARYLVTLVLPGPGHYAIGRGRRGVVWLLATLLGSLGLVLALWLGRSGQYVVATFLFGALLVVSIRLAALIDLALIKPAEPLPSGAEIAPGDIVALHPPQKPDEIYVKRVLAVAHDTIEFNRGVPVISGAELPREISFAPCSYSEADPDGHETVYKCQIVEETRGAHRYQTYSDPDRSPTSELPVDVPEGQIFVVGDNRDHSLDSRRFGLVPIENVIGKAFMINELEPTEEERAPAAQ